MCALPGCQAVAQWVKDKEGEIKEYLTSSLQQRLAAVEAQIEAQEARLAGRSEADTSGNETGEREGMGGPMSAVGEGRGSKRKKAVPRRGLRAVGDVEDMDAHVGEEADGMEGEDHFEFGLDEPGNDDGEGEEDGETDVAVASDAEGSPTGSEQPKEEGQNGGDGEHRAVAMEVAGTNTMKEKDPYDCSGEGE